MKRHYQLAVVGEDNKHVAVRINAIFEFCAVHDALMALEELVRFSVPSLTNPRMPSNPDSSPPIHGHVQKK